MFLERLAPSRGTLEVRAPWGHATGHLIFMSPEGPGRATMTDLCEKFPGLRDNLPGAGEEGHSALHPTAEKRELHKSCIPSCASTSPRATQERRAKTPERAAWVGVCMGFGAHWASWMNAVTYDGYNRPHNISLTFGDPERSL